MVLVVVLLFVIDLVVLVVVVDGIIYHPEDTMNFVQNVWEEKEDWIEIEISDETLVVTLQRPPEAIIK